MKKETRITPRAALICAAPQAITPDSGPVASSKRTRFGALLTRATLLLAMLLGLAAPAMASHFRYGNMSWERTATPGQVRFFCTQGWRRTAYGGTAPDGRPAVGDIIPILSISTGDGGSTGYNYKVVAIDIPNDNFLAVLVDGSGNTGELYTYSTPGNYTAIAESCCRISNLAGGANDGAWRLTSLVVPFGANSSPTSSQVPVVPVPQSAAATFTVSASDPNGDGLRFRIATVNEAQVPMPAGLTINANSGLVTWDTSSLAVNSLWAVQVIVEDLDGAGNVKTQCPLDFIIRIVANTGVPPGLTINPPGPFNVPPNTPISVTITATDADAGNNVTLNTGGAPGGATNTPGLPISGPGNPGVSTTFNWTPAGPGNNVVLYTATDSTGLQTQGSFQVNVSNFPPPTAATDAASGVTQTGATLNGTVNPTGTNTSVRFDYGTTLSYGQSTAPQPIGNGNANVPVSATIGGLTLNTVYHFRVVATNSGGTTLGGDLTFTTAGMANAAPSATISGPASSLEGDTFTVTATATDTDGTIAKVEFYEGVTKLGEDTTFPYSLDVSGLVVGNYSLTAVATDDDGDTGTSAPLAHTVNPAVPSANPDFAFCLTSVRLKPLRNDTTPGASSPLTLLSIGTPSSGTATLNADSSVTFRSPTNVSAPVSFTYLVENGFGRQATGTVTIFPVPPRGSLFTGHLVDAQNNVRGIVNYTFSSQGGFSVRASYDGARFSNGSRLTGESPLERRIHSAGRAPVDVEISAGPLLGGNPSLHTVLVGPGLTALAERSPYSSANQATAIMGGYTAVIPADSANAGDLSLPQGSAPLSVRVNRTGSVRIVGRTSDNTGVSMSSVVLTNNTLPFYAPSSARTRLGWLSGTMSIGTGPGPEIGGTSLWRVPAAPLAPLWPQGFSATSGIIGSRFTRQAAPSGFLDLSGGQPTLDFDGGNLPGPVSVPVEMGAASIVGGTAPVLGVGFSLTRGFYNGKIHNSANNLNQKFFGVVLQHPSLNRGEGFVIGPTQSGFADINVP